MLLKEGVKMRPWRFLIAGLSALVLFAVLVLFFATVAGDAAAPGSPTLAVTNDANHDGTFSASEQVPSNASFPYTVTYQLTINTGSRNGPNGAFHHIDSITDSTTSNIGSCQALVGTDIALNTTETCTYTVTLSGFGSVPLVNKVAITWDLNQASGDTTTGSSTVRFPAQPVLTSHSGSAVLGQPISDVAHLSGSSAATGTISWNVYDLATDPSCQAPLNRSPLTVTVAGNGDYTSPTFTPSAPGTFEWVASYSGDANNAAVSTTCNDPNERSTVSRASAPSISIVKLQRDGSTGSFTRSILTIAEILRNFVVHRIEYQIQVTNTGNVPLTLSLFDSYCDPGTIRGPTAISGTLTGDVLSPGAEATYACSHDLLQSDPSPFTNVATVFGQPPTGPSVRGTSQVTVKKGVVSPVHVCRTPSGRTIKYHGSKKPSACMRKRHHRHRHHHHPHHHHHHRTHSRRPKRPSGFTG